MTEALVSPTLLRWARERAALAPERLAKQLGVQLHLLTNWENGVARPSFRQAEKLAAETHVPFGFLFLSEPPEEPIPFPDLRTLAGDPARRLSADFLDLVHDVRFKQDWFREHLIERGANKLEFVGRFTLDTPVDVVATDIRAVLHDDTEGAAAANWEQRLITMFERCEDAGIWVIRTGVVGNNTHRPLSVSEFRGFAIADDIAPLIVINGRDARAAQAFTMAHELAHIWLGRSAVSDPGLDRSPKDVPELERRCNAIAAEVLVPRVAFLRRWNDEQNLVENAEFLSRHFKVSRAVIARRGFDLGKIDWERYRAFWAQESATWGEREKSSGGDYYRTVPVRNGKIFTRAVVTSALRGTMLLRDAGQLLGVKPARVQKLFDSLTATP